MALPVILVDSATGSDSAASGAGPTTALTGTAASTDGAGTTVTLDAGTDLSGVATDGSHVVWINDSTASQQNFGKITGTAGSGGATPTVTVATAFQASLSGKTWAIGGKRATVLGTSSQRLLTKPDAKTGWIIRMLSGHSETSSGAIVTASTLGGTSGPVTVEGESGSATMPLITFTNNGRGLDCGSGLWFRDFEVRNNNATKTSSYAFNMYLGAGPIFLERIRATHATDKFKSLIYMERGGYVVGCEIANMGSDGILISYSNSSATSVFILYGNYIHDNGGCGINCPSNGTWQGVAVIRNNLIVGNTGDGIYATGYSNSAYYIENNTIDGNGGDGIELATGAIYISLLNNLVTSNGGYGYKTNGIGRPFLWAHGNQSYGNTSGAWDTAAVADPDDLNVDPNYIGSGDFTPQEATLEGTAYPTSIP